MKMARAYFPAPAGHVYCANSWCPHLVSEARARISITRGLCEDCNSANLGAHKRENEPQHGTLELERRANDDGFSARLRAI